MSPETYRAMIEQLNLTAQLLEADLEIQSGAPTIPAGNVFSELRDMIHEQMQD